MGEERTACKIPVEETEARRTRTTLRPGRFSPGEICLSIYWWLGGSQSHSWHFGEDNFLSLSRIETRFPGFSLRSLFSIWPTISRLKAWQRYLQSYCFGGWISTRFNFASQGWEWPIPVAARSKAWVWGRSFTGIAGSNLAGGMDVCILWVLCVLSGSGLCDGPILVHWSPIDCGMCVRVCVTAI